MLKFYESMKTHISLFSKYLSSKEISVAYKWAFLQTKKIKFDFLLYVLYLDTCVSVAFMLLFLSQYLNAMIWLFVFPSPQIQILKI